MRQPHLVKRREIVKAHQNRDISVLEALGRSESRQWNAPRFTGEGMTQTSRCSGILGPRRFPPMNIGISFEQVGQAVLRIPRAFRRSIQG